MPVPDFWLVRRARSGDPAAFGVLYDRHAPRVYGLLRRLSGDATASEDLTQETFLSAYRSLNAWRGAGAFSSWLCGIAVRCYRNANRRRIPEDELDETAPADSGSDPLARCTAGKRRTPWKTPSENCPTPAGRRSCSSMWKNSPTKRWP